ncbi:hypothetical protein NKDENANG_02878 [Candidatus Entotheonellaceae bacterium PAL068K]
MRQRRAHSLGWYAALSSLLHLLFILWMSHPFRHLRPEDPLYAPVRVTLVAPALPSGTLPDAGPKAPVPAQAMRRPATPKAPASFTTPVVTAMATPSPLAPPTSVPQPRDRGSAQQLPLPAVSVPLQVPKPLTPIPSQPTAVSALLEAPEAPPVSAPSSTTASLPAPTAPAFTAPHPSQPRRALDTTSPGQMRLTAPAPQTLQIPERLAAPQATIASAPIAAPQAPAAGAITTASLPAPVAPAPTAPRSSQLPRPPDAPPRPISVAPPRLQTVQRSLPTPRVIAKAPSSTAEPDPTPHPRLALRPVASVTPGLVHSTPSLAPAARRTPTHVTLTASPSLPNRALPPPPATPRAVLRPTRQSRLSPPPVSASAPSMTAAGVSAPPPPVPAAAVPMQPRRSAAQPPQERVTSLRPQVARRLPLLPRTDTKTFHVVTPAAPMTPDPYASTMVAALPSTPVPTQPPRQPSPAPTRWRIPADVSRLTPAWPIDALPPVSFTPTPRVPSVHQLPSATLPRTSPTPIIPVSRPTPPPASVAPLPAGQASQPQERDSPYQERMETPPLARSTSGSSPPSRTRTGNPSRTALGQVPTTSRPRFPPHCKPAYPLKARRRGWEGTVVLDYNILANGRVGDVKIVKSSGYPILDRVAKKAAKKCQHIPEQHNGKAVTQRAKVPFVWTLKGTN